MGAFLNVKINAAGCHDKQFVDEALKRGSEMERAAQKAETEVLQIVNGKISG